MINVFINQLTQKPNQQTKIVTKQKSYAQKVQEEAFNLFTAKDVVEHFCRYYKKANGKDKDFNRDNAVLLVGTLNQQYGLNNEVISLYIEFVFDSDQTFIDKEKAGLGTFKIQKFVDYIEANVDAWEDGQSIQTVEETKTAIQKVDRNKEWDRNKSSNRVIFELPQYS